MKNFYVNTCLIFALLNCVSAVAMFSLGSTFTGIFNLFAAGVCGWAFITTEI